MKNQRVHIEYNTIISSKLQNEKYISMLVYLMGIVYIFITPFLPEDLYKDPPNINELFLDGKMENRPFGKPP